MCCMPVASKFVHSFYLGPNSKYFCLLYCITACENNNIKQYKKDFMHFPFYITYYIYMMIM